MAVRNARRPSPADRTPDKIRDGLIAAIASSDPANGSPQAQLLSHLEASKAGTPHDHKQMLTNYAMACKSREPKALLRDVLKMRSLQRQLVYADDGKLDDASGTGLHPYAVFEFPQTMPVDNVKVTAHAAPDAQPGDRPH